MQPYRLLEALQLGLTLVGEVEALTGSQLLHDVGRQYLPRLSLGTHPGRQLNRRAEEVIILSHRLTGVEANADADGGVGAVLVVFRTAASPHVAYSTCGNELACVVWPTAYQLPE